jgi:hypothetical protein
MSIRQSDASVVGQVVVVVVDDVVPVQVVVQVHVVV